MKNLFLAAITLFLFLYSVQKTGAQTTARNRTLQRCGTTAAYQELFKNDPGFRKKFEESQRTLKSTSVNQTNNTARTALLADTIPIVIHVVAGQLHCNLK